MSRFRSGLSIAAVLFVSITTIAYGITGSPFEGTDGDLVPLAGTDWFDFDGSPQLMIGHDKASGSMDDSLKGKEDDPEPGITVGSIPGNKSDLLRFYLVHEQLGPEGDEHDYLYLAWVRDNTLGTALMDFEFNQSKALTENGVTPVRTPGDLLITFGFSGGGSVVELGMLEWTETGPCEASTSPPCWGEMEPLGGHAEGAVNLEPVPDPIEGVMLPELTFGEAVIDLTGAGIFDRQSCTSFGHAMVKSRSSDSFTASLKDFISPIDASVSNCALLTVTKDAVPDDHQDFSFTSPGGLSPASFELDDDADDALPRSRSWEAPLEGPYTVTELDVDGWDLTDVSCTGDATPELDPEGIPTGEVDMILAKGARIDCTFTNTKRGRILIDQVTIPGGDPQQFQFHLTGGPDGIAQDFFLADASPMHDSGTIRPGTYSALQEDPGLAWDPTSASCSDGSPVDQIELDPGETVVCTFTNTKRGQILIDNDVIPAGDPQPFDFTLTGGPSGLGQVFQLADPDPPHASGLVLPGGGYIATRALPPGYYPVSASCDDGSPVGNIVVDPGETVLCTFVSRKGGRILIDKVTDPAGDPATFDFTLTGGPSTANQAFSLADTDPLHDSGWLEPGAGYVAIEAPAAGWDLTGLGCVSATGGSTADVQGASADIDLGVADTVTCTFTNTKRGTIIVMEDSIPDDAQDFQFDMSGPGMTVSFSLDDDGGQDNPLSSSHVFADMPPGECTVSQDDAGPAWDLVDIECTDSFGASMGAIDMSTASASFDLPPGETITCLYTNVKRGTMIVDKFVVNEPVAGVLYNPRGIPFEFNPSWGEIFWLKHGESTESPYLPGGESHTVSESPPSGWSTSSLCIYPDGTMSSGGATASVTIPAGETVHCTFTNELRVHPGSSGFWRNWDNHYSDDQFLMIMSEAFDDSACYSSLFDFGVLVPDAIDIFSSIYSMGSGSTDQKVLRELTSLMMNLAVSKSDDPAIRALQRNHDVCRECIIDVSGIPGAAELIEEWNPSINFGQLVVGDAIAVAEALWSGDISLGIWSFDPLSESEKQILADILEGINQGTVLTPDLTTYPDRPGCLTVPGLSEATELVFYSTTIEVNETGAVFGVLAGDLPPGLQIDQNTLDIYGIPEPVGLVPVTYHFALAVSVWEEGKFAIRDFSITVNPWPQITTISCPDAVEETPYVEDLQSMGGTGPLQWSIASGDLPDGLSMDPATGLITGTPARLRPSKPTSFPFEMALTDANGAQSVSPMSIMVVPAGEAVCESPQLTSSQASDLEVTEWLGETYLFWTAVSGATGYDVIHGDLGLLRSTGSFVQSTAGCVVPSYTATSMSISLAPAAGDTAWFLVRPNNCAGGGTFDSGLSSQPASRDLGIQSSGNSCN